MRVLYCGSDQYTRRFLRAALDSNWPQIELLQAEDVVEAKALLESCVCQLLVMDCRGTDPDRVSDVVRTVRTVSPGSAILILACPGAATLDEIVALRAGADDWLVFPLPLEELAARCDVLLRRIGGVEPSDRVFHCEQMKFEELAHRVAGPRGTVELTWLETRLLACLVSHAGRCVAPADLLGAVWDSGPGGGANQVKVGVYRLRRKLKSAGIPPSTIENQKRYGYRLNVEGQAPEGHV